MRMGMRQRFAEGQTAAAKKIAMGASTASSQRQGYWRKRHSGSRYQMGREMGKRRTKTAAGRTASGIHQRRERLDFCGASVPRRQQMTVHTTATAIMETAISEAV